MCQLIALVYQVIGLTAMSTKLFKGSYCRLIFSCQAFSDFQRKPFLFVLLDLWIKIVICKSIVCKIKKKCTFTVSEICDVKSWGCDCGGYASSGFSKHLNRNLVLTVYLCCNTRVICFGKKHQCEDTWLCIC